MTEGMNFDMTTVPNPICRQCGSARVWQKGRYRCRVCLTRSQASRVAAFSAEQRRAEKDQSNRLRKIRRADDPVWRAKQDARVQRWRDANSEAYRAGARDWYARNADRARAAKLADYYADPEKFYARNLLRKARTLEAVCAHGPECVDSTFLTALYARSCVYCGLDAQAADHLFPLARSGAHCRDNLVPSCGACNSSKSARDPFEWLMSLT